MYSPLYVDFNITNYCNLKCKFCYMKKYLNTKEMALIECFKIIDDLNSSKVMKVHISGGEPFLHPNICEIIDYLKYKKMRYSISTNGTIINKNILKCILDYPPDFIGISHPSINKYECENRGMIKLNHEVNQTIKSFLKYKLNVSVGFTITKTNMQSILASIKLLEDIGIDTFGFQFICPIDYESINEIPNYSEYKIFINTVTDTIINRDITSKILINTTNESKIPWEMYLPLKDRIDDLKKVWGYDQNKMDGIEKNSCTAGKFGVAIDSYGNVFGCEMFFNYKQLSYGNIFEENIVDIWNNRKLLNTQKRYLHGKCSKCNLDICNGSCRAAAMYYKDLAYSDLRCPYNTYFKNEIK